MKRLIPVLAAAAVVALSGCVDYEEKLTLNADGSGQIAIHFAMDKAFMNRMEAMAEQFGGETSEDSEGPDEICPEEEMRASLAAMGSGLELLRYEMTETDEEFVYELAFKFSDYEDFKDLERVCPEEDADESPTTWEFSYAQQADGTWLFERYFYGDKENAGASAEAPTAPDYAGATDEDGAEAMDFEALAEMMEGLGEAMSGLAPEAGEGSESAPEVDLQATMQEFAAGMQEAAEEAKNHTVKMVVQLPGEVIESNATSVSGRTATWEYTLDQMDAAPTPFFARVKP